MARNAPFSKTAGDRRAFLRTALTAGAAAMIHPTLSPELSAGREIASSPIAIGAEVKPFELEEITITELQNGMASGKYTARSLVEQYTVRVNEIDKRGPAVNAIIELNPEALSIAETLDQERKAKGPR